MTILDYADNMSSLFSRFTIRHCMCPDDPMVGLADRYNMCDLGMAMNEFEICERCWGQQPHGRDLPQDDILEPDMTMSIEDIKDSFWERVNQ